MARSGDMDQPEISQGLTWDEMRILLLAFLRTACWEATTGSEFECLPLDLLGALRCWTTPFS